MKLEGLVCTFELTFSKQTNNCSRSIPLVDRAYLHCCVLLLKDPHNAYATKQQKQ